MSLCSENYQRPTLAKKDADEDNGGEDKLLSSLYWDTGFNWTGKDEAIQLRFRFLQVQGRMTPICSSALSPSNKIIRLKIKYVKFT